MTGSYRSIPDVEVDPIHCPAFLCPCGPVGALYCGEVCVCHNSLWVGASPTFDLSVGWLMVDFDVILFVASNLAVVFYCGVKYVFVLKVMLQRIVVLSFSTG